MPLYSIVDVKEIIAFKNYTQTPTKAPVVYTSAPNNSFLHKQDNISASFLDSYLLPCEQGNHSNLDFYWWQNASLTQ